MRVGIKKLELQNFRRFKHAEIEFHPGVFLVQGKNFDENFDSNGSGKSSLFCGLSWALFGKFFSPDGKIVKGASVVNKEVGRDCSARVEVVVGGEEFVLERFCSHHQFKNLFKCTPRARNPLGCSFETFCTLVLFHSGNDLFYGTSQKKRDFLCSLFAIDKFVAGVKGIAREKKRLFSEQVNELITMKEVLRSEVNLMSERLREHRELVNTLDEQIKAKEKSIRECVDELKTLKKRYSQLKSDRVNLHDYDRELSSIKREIDSIDFFESEIREKEKSTNSCNFDVQRLEQTLKRLNDVSEESVCPTCLQPIDLVQLSSVMDQKRKELELKREEFKLLASELKEIVERKKAAERKVAELEKRYRDVREKKIRLESQFTAELTQLEKSFEGGLGRLKSFRNELQVLKQKRKSVQPTQELERSLKQRKNTLKHLPETLDCLSFLANRYEWWSQAISTEFVSFALGTFYDKIGKLSTRLLKSVWGSSVSVVLNDSGISIRVRGQDFKLQELSTGEQKRIFLAVALASNLIARQFSGWTCNLLVFDEVFDGLDSQGRSDLIGMVKSLTSEGYSVFVITHHVDFDLSSFDGVFTVVRRDGVSVLERRLCDANSS